MREGASSAVRVHPSNQRSNSRDLLWRHGGQIGVAGLEAFPWKLAIPKSFPSSMPRRSSSGVLSRKYDLLATPSAIGRPTKQLPKAQRLSGLLLWLVEDEQPRMARRGVSPQLEET